MVCFVLKSLHQKIKQYSISLNLKKDNRLVVFMICLLIASVIWFVNALGKRYETYVTIPIQYTKLPKNKVLVEAPPSSVQVKMEAYGFILLRHKIKLTIDPINFNVSLFTDHLMDKSDASEFNIISDRYIKQIADQVSANIKILDITPDTLHFVFDKIVSEKKKVVHNFELSFENQFFLYDSIFFEPDSVLVSGPKKMLDTISVVKTKKQKFKDLNSSIRRNIALEDIDDAEISPRRVVVEIPVSLFNEYTGFIPVSKQNVPDSLNLITFPGKIEVKCIVAFNNYGKLNPSSFIFSVDYQDIGKNGNTLPISVYRLPSHIKSLNFQPLEVEYIIEKK